MNGSGGVNEAVQAFCLLTVLLFSEGVTATNVF